MRVNRLSVKGYRNLSSAEFFPSERVNLIYGKNAQGKTNLLEALWIFTGGHSFRGAKDGELVGFSEKKAELTMDFFASGREQSAQIIIENGRRKIFLNEIPIKAPAEFVGNFCSVIFSPTHLSLVKEGPAERRAFLDAAICQIKPSYARLLSAYRHSVEERNALLKNLYTRPYLEATLDAWDEQICRLGSGIISERQKYLSLLTPFTQKIYSGFSAAREELSLAYECSFSLESGSGGEDIYRQMLAACRANRKEDIHTAHTSVGPHRDDMDLQINRISARKFGSQGQQRSAVLSLKLSEAEILHRMIGEYPVVLLDDVMSELDASRQDYILNQMEGWQVFVTCCEPAASLRLLRGKAFSMEQGVLSEDSADKAPA